MTTYYEKPFIFDNESVKKNTVIVTAGKDINGDFHVIVNVFIQVEKEFVNGITKKKGKDLFGYTLDYRIFTEDGGIESDGINKLHSDLDGIPKEVLEELVSKTRTLAHEKLAELQKHGEIKTSSVLRSNIEALIGSGVSAYSVSKATGIPNNTVVRIFRGEAKLDNITLRNAEILSNYWEEMNKKD